MTVNEYQSLAMATLNPELNKRDVLINSVMGLCGESGEAIDIVKKWMAQGHELDKVHLAKELGANTIRLDTFSWQGKEFYEALGYQIVGHYENETDGYAEYFFLKRI